MYKLAFPCLVALALASACSPPQTSGNAEQSTDRYKPGSFGYDQAFLKSKDSVYTLQTSNGKGQIIVSAKYQGKVFTSTASGDTGRSFGWVNYKAFSGKPDEHMNGYGGEDRLWLGPEGNRFSLFFKPGAKMVFDNWHTPAAFDTEKWDVVSSSKSGVSLQKNMSLLNFAGITLNLAVNRDVRILEKDQIEKNLDIKLDPALQFVGFETVNTLKNTGKTGWTPQTGAPCLWNLDMFAPAKGVTILIPFNKDATGKIATTDYFGQIPDERIKYQNGTLLFKADGRQRGKLGLSPLRAKNVAGSYDREHRVLTITRFDVDRNATYLNQEWKTTVDALKGDAVNAYNDGPLADGKQMGPFYEIESVSPAGFLNPGKILRHRHDVYHFTGDPILLNKLTRLFFALSIDEINAAFSDGE